MIYLNQRFTLFRRPVLFCLLAAVLLAFVIAPALSAKTTHVYKPEDMGEGDPDGYGISKEGPSQAVIGILPAIIRIQYFFALLARL